MPAQPDSTSASDSQLIRERALGLLARREHGCAELRRKLLNKGFFAREVDEVLAALVREGLLSDRRYTEAFVHSRVGRGQGPLKIRAELAQNAIDDVIVEEVMRELDIDWWAQAAEVRVRKFRNQKASTYEEKTRQGRFLASRGFPSDIIWHVIGEPGE